MSEAGTKTQVRGNGSANDKNGPRGWWREATQVFTFGWTVAIPVVAFLWTIVILIYALSLPGGVRWGAFATAVITGSCSFLGGGLVGLLFGIPRSAPASGQAKTTGQYVANSNLVEVSDWLTKIIVGVGLVQIGRLLPVLTRLAASLKAPLGGQASSGAFGIALVIANVLLGFLFFYLWTRSLLARNLELSDGGGEGSPAPPQATQPSAPETGDPGTGGRTADATPPGASLAG